MYKNGIDSPSNIIRKNENVTNFNLQVDDCTEHNKKLVSDTLNSCDNFNKYFVKTRVYLLRHYPYVKTKHYIDYDKLLKCKISGNIDQDGINELKRLGNLLEIYDKLDNIPDELSSIYYNIFSSPDTIFYYDMSDEKNRVSLTAKDLIDKFGSKMLVNDEIYINDSGLIPSNKTLESGESFGKLYTNFNDFYHSEVRKIIKDYGVKNIVIVSNRSYASSFEIIGGGEITKSIKDSVDQLEKDGYLYLDYDLSGNLIKYSFDTIQVTPLNLQSIKESIDNIGIEFEYLSIEEFQNGLNKYFQQNPSLFQQFLNDSKITNHDLHIFCLANLLKDLNTNKEVIKKFIFGLRGENKSEEELKQIYDLFQGNCYSFSFNNTIFLRLYELGLNICNNEIKSIVTVISESDNRALEIKNNSVDKKIRECLIDELNDILINREICYYERKSNEDIKLFEKQIDEGKIFHKIDYYNKKTSGDMSILFSNRASIISSSVGDGKSIELLKLKIEIDNNINMFNYITLFYTSKSLSKYDSFETIKSRIENDIFLLYHFTEQNIILFFDGIDEINTEYKDELKEYLINGIFETFSTYLNNNALNVLLGSRRTEFEEFGNNNYGNFSFNILNDNQIRNFLHNKISCTEDKEKKLQKIIDFLKKGLIDSDLKNTPLVLYFLTQLSIREIECIDNRSNLYEIIILNILTKHNNVNSSICLIAHIPQLSIFAYKLFKNEKIDVSDEMLQSYAFLFKKVGDNQYQFIHNSFYEFFLAKYLSDDENGAQKIYNYRDINFDKWNNWRNFKHVISFYCDFLIVNDKIDFLRDFLGKSGILMNDDLFGENFFIGLHNLSKLELKYGNDYRYLYLKKFYLSEITKWKKGVLLNKMINFRNCQGLSDVYSGAIFSCLSKNFYDLPKSANKNLNVESEIFVNDDIFGDSCIDNNYILHLFKELLSKFNNLDNNINDSEKSIVQNIEADISKVLDKILLIGDEKLLKYTLELLPEKLISYTLFRARIYLELSIKDSKYIKKFFLCTKKLPYDDSVEKLYYKLFTLGDNNLINISLNFVNNYYFDNKSILFPVNKLLIEIGNYKFLNEAYNVTKKIITKGNYKLLWKFYVCFVENGNKKYFNLIIDDLKDLLYNRKCVSIDELPSYLYNIIGIRDIIGKNEITDDDINELKERFEFFMLTIGKRKLWLKSNSIPFIYDMISTNNDKLIKFVIGILGLMTNRYEEKYKIAIELIRTGKKFVHQYFVYTSNLYDSPKYSEWSGYEQYLEVLYSSNFMIPKNIGISYKGPTEFNKQRENDFN
ncbi:MAG: hypothetical protein PHS49_02855 [Candidatus Gracilibacteria bacterium]|nr:hypothetical protein [Candidatus Gracilibacteria bacterium]